MYKFLCTNNLKLYKFNYIILIISSICNYFLKYCIANILPTAMFKCKWTWIKLNRYIKISLFLFDKNVDAKYLMGYLNNKRFRYAIKINWKLRNISLLTQNLCQRKIAYLYVNFVDFVFVECTSSIVRTSKFGLYKVPKSSLFQQQVYQ